MEETDLEEEAHSIVNREDREKREEVLAEQIEKLNLLQGLTRDFRETPKKVSPTEDQDQIDKNQAIIIFVGALIKRLF